MKDIFVHTKPFVTGSCYYKNVAVNLKYCSGISLKNFEIFFAGIDVSWMFGTEEEAKKCYDKLIELYSIEL